MTPFGARLRALRADRGITLKRLAEALQVSAAYLSALEHGRRGSPSAGLVHQVNEFFGLIWDEADELVTPRAAVQSAGDGQHRRADAGADRAGQSLGTGDPPPVAGNRRGAACRAGHDGAAIEAAPPANRALAGIPCRGSGRTLRRRPWFPRVSGRERLDPRLDLSAESCLCDRQI